MNPWKTLKKLPKNLWIIFFTTLINRAGTMALPFLILYLTDKEGFGASDAGLVLSAYGISALITSPFVGRLSDKLGSLKVMKLSLIFSGLILFIYPFFDSYNLILCLTFIWSIISEAFRPASLSLVSEIVSPAQRRTAFAINRLAINIGMSIGPVVGGLLTLINYSVIFYVDGLTAISAGIFLIFAPWQKTTTENLTEGTDREIIEHSNVLKDRKFIYFLFAILPISMIFFQHLGALPLYIVNHLKFSPAVFGALAAVNTVLIIFVEVPLNNAMSSFSIRNSLMLGALLTAIGFGALAFSFNLFAVVVTIIIWTFGEMIFFPVSSVFVSESSPSKKRGEYMGYYQMTFSLAFTIGPWLGTKILETYGAFTLWIGIFILGLFSILMISFIKEKNHVRI